MQRDIMLVITTGPYFILFRAYQSTFKGDPYHYPDLTWDMQDKSHVMLPRKISCRDGMRKKVS